MHLNVFLLYVDQILGNKTKTHSIQQEHKHYK